MNAAQRAAGLAAVAHPLDLSRGDLARAAAAQVGAVVDDWTRLTPRAQVDVLLVLARAVEDLRAIGVLK